ncbi:hypothetical protein OS493_023979 [Desmophyllum pertusum]|uniref:Uncharacterized protein n=1 Tax=Desmophyllum pertusum TaxID=174260 RepID=A0A9W9ZZY7_9CNID|nr:hypothetical protein OS493_023979 [Desmophyllum pertusum]
MQEDRILQDFSQSHLQVPWPDSGKKELSENDLQPKNMERYKTKWTRICGQPRFPEKDYEQLKKERDDLQKERDNLRHECDRPTVRGVTPCNWSVTHCYEKKEKCTPN